MSFTNLNHEHCYAAVQPVVGKPLVLRKIKKSDDEYPASVFCTVPVAETPENMSVPLQFGVVV